MRINPNIPADCGLSQYYDFTPKHRKPDKTDPWAGNPDTDKYWAKGN